MPTPENDRIGRYVLLSPIGRGGMGVVYRGFDPRLARPVAIKLLAGAGDQSARMLREAQAMARLSDPNVVQVYDAGVAGDQVYIAMELVDGIDLAGWLAAPRRWEDVLERFAAAGRGLAAAHAAGMVHRDFKPGNVLVSESGRVLVGDFGLARPLGQAGRYELDSPIRESGGTETMTLTGVGQGTPRYMAPEQRTGETLDARADQYSFCVALAEALHAAGAPRRVLDPVARGLCADRSARYPSMDALLAALGSARQPAPRRRSRGWIAAVAVAAIGIAAALVSIPEERSVAAATPEIAPAPAPTPEPAATPAPAPAPAPEPEPALEPAPAPKKVRKRRRAERPKPKPRRPDPEGLIRDPWRSAP